MIILDRILGSAGDPELAGRLHRLEHEGRLESLWLGGDEIARRRLRRNTDQGTECAIVLARHDRLHDSAVLYLNDERGIVVRVGKQSWLKITPMDAAAALALGYLAGNLHWKVSFQGDVLLVAQSGPPEDYQERLSELTARYHSKS